MRERKAGWYFCLPLGVNAVDTLWATCRAQQVRKNLRDAGSGFIYLDKGQKSFGKGAWSSRRTFKIFSYYIASDNGV